MTRQNQLLKVLVYHKQTQEFKGKYEHSKKRNEKKATITSDLSVKF